MSIPSPRFFAPYVYFCKNSNGPKYYVFVKLHLKAGTTAQRVTLNTIGVKYLVKDDKKRPNDYAFFDVLELNPPAQVPANGWAEEFGINEAINPLDNTFAITVEHQSSIKDADTKSSYSILVVYNDAPIDSPVLPLQIETPFLERPYAYLTDPNSDPNTPTPQTIEFVPRLVIPLPATGQRIASSYGAANSSQGTYTDVIAVDSNNLPPDTIDTNAASTKYTDSGAVAGYYEARITVAGAGGASTTYTMKIRNKSSDRRPNNFIKPQPANASRAAAPRGTKANKSTSKKTKKSRKASTAPKDKTPE